MREAIVISRLPKLCGQPSLAMRELTTLGSILGSREHPLVRIVPISEMWSVRIDPGLRCHSDNAPIGSNPLNVAPSAGLAVIVAETATDISS